jgi:hypothetical protein
MSYSEYYNNNSGVKRKPDPLTLVNGVCMLNGREVGGDGDNNDTADELSASPQPLLYNTRVNPMAPPIPQFDRLLMSVDREDNRYLVEGYWAPTIRNTTTGYPWPRSYGGNDWPNKDRFLEKLRRIELLLSPDKLSFRGLSPSRFVRGQLLGNKEFIDHINCVRWPEDYADHYVRMHNVMPSAQFYDYVEQFEIVASPSPTSSSSSPPQISSSSPKHQVEKSEDTRRHRSPLRLWRDHWDSIPTATIHTPIPPLTSPISSSNTSSTCRASIATDPTVRSWIQDKLIKSDG